MKMTPSQKQNLTEWIVLSTALLLAAAFFVWFAHQVNIEDGRVAFDWKILWMGIENGRIHWENTIWVPPLWSLIFVLPLGFFSLRFSLGLVMFITFVALFLSVPRTTGRLRYGLALFLLLTSFPVMRNFADANIDAFVVLGVLLIIFSYQEDKPILLSLGLLMAAIKPQGIILLYLVLIIYILMTKTFPFILKAGLTTLILALPPTLWGWERWFVMLMTRAPLGISISGTLKGWGVPNAAIIPIQIIFATATVVLALAGNRKLSRIKAGFLIAGSMLVSPYAGGLLLLAILAIGVIPLFLEKPFLGVILFVLYDLAYLAILPTSKLFETWVSPYTTLLVLISWTILGVMVYQEEIATRSTEVESEAIEPATV
jgi:hypothetical protein